MKYWFTADLHFNHANIIKYCHRNLFLCDKDSQALRANGGSWHSGEWKSNLYKISEDSVDYMNQSLIQEINDHISEYDVLYILGDIGFFNSEEQAEYFRSSIHCRTVYSVYGNHDKFIRPFNPQGDIFNINIRGQKITLCHYAMMAWDSSHRGAWNLYGHSHSEIEDIFNEKFPERMSMDVGVDNIFKLTGSYRPIEFKELVNIFKVRKGHTKQTNSPREVHV